MYWYVSVQWPFYGVFLRILHTLTIPHKEAQGSMYHLVRLCTIEAYEAHSDVLPSPSGLQAKFHLRNTANQFFSANLFFSERRMRSAAKRVEQLLGYGYLSKME
jgi:hypothetical protein